MSGIYKAICDIMNDVDFIGKGNYNKEQRYDYRSIDDFYNKLHPIFVNHGVFTTSEVTDIEYRQDTTKSGTVMTNASMTVKFKFHHLDGSFVETTVVTDARDSGDKHSVKAMAMAHKIALAQILMIPTEDISDGDEGDEEGEVLTPETEARSLFASHVSEGEQAIRKIFLSLSEEKQKQLRGFAESYKKQAIELEKNATGNSV